ncbi:hypothetical protein B0H63DRAFT_543508 [Podospora didyma]|uniref:Uncharacterized protein n=1 Tax=Podospora didyma TaxID=330526 RepID=A0AAE0NPE6_9PEZI|nr:hypothetical protein B0H63DRAFT_543508 [Podospora didyma]
MASLTSPPYRNSVLLIPKARRISFGSSNHSSTRTICAWFSEPDAARIKARIQTDPAQNLIHLQSLLGHLSPSGRTLGLDDSGNPNTSCFNNENFEQYINTSVFG